MRLLLAILLLLLAAPASAQQSQGMSKAMVVSSCGGGALPSGALNQLTMDTSGRLCQVGVSSSVCAQAAAYLARTAGGNEGGNATNISPLICGLVVDGVWSKLDAFYVFAQQNQADALLNLVGTSYTATLSGAPAFVGYVGFGPFPGGSTAVASNFNPATAVSPNYVQDSASFGVWSKTIVVEDVSQMGTTAASQAGESNIFNDYTDGQFYGTINGSTAIATAPGTVGFYEAERTSSSATTLYFNGVSQATSANATAPPQNAAFYVGIALGGPLGSGQVLSEADIGASLGATGQLALYNRLRTYMTAVGIP
jgi:hypothetical protein